MDKNIIFAIFSMVVSVGSLVGVLFIRRSNRKFLEQEREAEQLNKKVS